MKPMRVGVLMGGDSAEREVSLRSGAAVAGALSELGHDVIRLDTLTLGSGEKIASAGLDAAFLALHGTHGEDGCVQGLLELLGVPYTGSSLLASALAMDKVKSKELFRLHNVPTPPYHVIPGGARSALAPSEIAALHGSFGYPVVVKPRAEGSSVGVFRAKAFDELVAAVGEVSQLGSDAVVERFIAGKEVTVALLDGRVLGAIEVCPKEGLYDYAAKYTPGATEYFLPARLEATRYRGVLNLAERAYEAVGCTGIARVDLLVTEGMNEYVLEVNTQPGMTETSLLPRIAAAAGFDFAALCQAILERAALHVHAPRRERAGVAATSESPGVPSLAVAV